mmetsp:Transcript_12402/g.31298  ORF Transcript_12402/g.31298 Transcript_12402/m.31298 type:complete len:370 (+) Transcript_12402:474-1583(+)
MEACRVVQILFLAAEARRRCRPGHGALPLRTISLCRSHSPAEVVNLQSGELVADVILQRRSALSELVQARNVCLQFFCFLGVFRVEPLLQSVQRALGNRDGGLHVKCVRLQVFLLRREISGAPSHCVLGFAQSFPRFCLDPGNQIERPRSQVPASTQQFVCLLEELLRVQLVPSRCCALCWCSLRRRRRCWGCCFVGALCRCSTLAGLSLSRCSTLSGGTTTLGLRGWRRDMNLEARDVMGHLKTPLACVGREVPPHGDQIVDDFLGLSLHIKEVRSCSLQHGLLLVQRVSEVILKVLCRRALLAELHASCAHLEGCEALHPLVFQLDAAVLHLELGILDLLHALEGGVDNPLVGRRLAIDLLLRSLRL